MKPDSHSIRLALGRPQSFAFHEPTVWCPGFSRSGPPEGGTPNKFCRKVRFMVPMHAERIRKRALHEPERRTPVRHGVVFSPSGNRAEREFGAPLFGSWSRCRRKKRKGAFHEPTVWCPGFSRSGPPEGGTPNKFSAKSGSWSQCMRKKFERGLSMNRGAPASLPPGCWCESRRRGRRSFRRRLPGSRSQCTRNSERSHSMNRPRGNRHQRPGTIR